MKNLKKGLFIVVVGFSIQVWLRNQKVCGEVDWLEVGVNEMGDRVQREKGLKGEKKQ